MVPDSARSRRWRRDRSAIRRFTFQSKTHLTLDQLEQHSTPVIELLNRLRVKFALVGGIAVSFRTVERTTKDLDIAVAVASDADAERLIHEFAGFGYFINQLIEHETQKRLATVRLVSRAEHKMCVDLLFATSGIEPEVVESAEEAHVFSGVNVRVATIPSLIAMKVLSANTKTRLQDIIDLQYLLKESTAPEIETARDLMKLITERGFNRNKDLLKDFKGFITQFEG